MAGPGLAREGEDGDVTLPLGLVGLTWLRLYLPLVKANLPQSTTNIQGGERLGFARDGFKALLEGLLSPLDLRVGAVFSGVAGVALHAALRDACDIDHASPWAAWPCGDLWNLLPANRRVNQHQKRDLLPSEAVLRRARERILRWWDQAYLAQPDILAARFAAEAQASLPGLQGPGQEMAPEEVFAAMGLQRLRLRLDQGMPEWTG